MITFKAFSSLTANAMYATMAKNREGRVASNVRLDTGVKQPGSSSGSLSTYRRLARTIAVPRAWIVPSRKHLCVATGVLIRTRDSWFLREPH